mmetsp:Transcript_17849/g.30290  ORF Transcript_17849/g.30290 Transcript_17849/m.30290 type:complete len:96 (+) Transcript_17849:253-540(+)
MMRRGQRELYWKNFIWKRPDQVYGRGNYSICDTASSEDLVPGQCLDHYFLQSLSNLAENRERLTSIFQVQKINPRGIYAMKVCVSGRPMTVVVDD